MAIQRMRSQLEYERAVPIQVDEGRRRAVVEAVTPQVDGGRFAIKRTLGERVAVEADAFADGHDEVRVDLLHRRATVSGWTETPMAPLGNDRWRGEFEVTHLGRYVYTVSAWVDHFATWRRDLQKRVEAGQDVSVDLLVGAQLVNGATERAHREDGPRLETWAVELVGEGSLDSRVKLALDDELADLMARHPNRALATTFERELEVVVDPVRASFSAWYELFPRSTSGEVGRHGTFRDVIGRLDYVADLGFDVLYLPPIHPIGRTFRKGANNATGGSERDPGVPWAIGGPEGGHTAIHPELGTLEDFRALVAEAERRGIAIALDLAFQSSPDHPYVREHPQWYRQRPDGTIQYAENPPKKYPDIYPFDFESEDWRGLWAEFDAVTRYWIRQGVHIFRVDNPHTKPFAFWEWLIDGIKRDEPDVIFLAEAFTRPKVMYRLAKLGFSQSYTYFTWRTTKAELADYFTELTRSGVQEFFRPNVWPNTPDILHEVLQYGGRPAFEFRLVLAATLAASYGIYGPAYELMEHVAREPGSEEYLNSEKYEIKAWDLDRPDSLAPLVAQLNRIRRAHPALHSNARLAFHPVDDERLLAYSKRAEDGSDIVLTIVNLDPHLTRSGMLHLPLDELGIDADHPFEVNDLLAGTTVIWQGAENRVELDPSRCPAMVLSLKPHVRSETDFEYFL
jgi:starch synthase (maltosyl-transferring)